MITPNVRPLNLPFRDVWSISDRQKGLISCTAISPSGMWLMSSSQDGIVVFVDHKAGALVGKLDLESQFYVTTAVWRSDTILLFGASNGTVYHLDFEHKNRRPVSAHVLIKPLNSPIRAIAFDSFRDMLGIACGGDVWIYVLTTGTGTESWDCVDHIPAPCAGTPGTVTTLCFFGTTLSRRHLFIGHAKAGWTIWFAPRSYHRTPFTEHGDVCSIGSATIPHNEQFIAIATLDRTLVTYSLEDGGPVADTRFEVNSGEVTKYSQDTTKYPAVPVMPIVAAANDLVLKGTAVGDIDILDPKTHSIASFPHAHNHVIRSLNAYGDKLIVGSFDVTEGRSGSSLRCYTLSTAAEPRDWRRIEEFNGPIFEITLSSILAFTQRATLYDHLGIFSIGDTVWFKLKQKRSFMFFFVGLVVLLVALASDTPSRVSSVTIRDLRISHKPGSRSATPSQKPTLSALITWCAGYLSGQVSEWVIWLTGFVAWMIKLVSFGCLMIVKNLFLTFTSLTRVVFTIPRLLKKALSEVPDVLVNLMCDVLRIYGFDDVCPE